MVPDVSTGSHTAGLLYYLFGPGRRDEHADAHIVAAWDMAGAPDPGRDPTATIGRLADRLDLHARLRAKETGTMPAKHVWHCPVRTAPGDRYLTDTEWAEVARRIVAATGIAPDGDDLACRWIAVRHADDHIHIAAVSVRADGRRARTHRDGWRAQAACRRIETEFGLRQLNPGDMTAPKTPTSAERAKAERLGRPVTSREWLREQAYAVLAAVGSEQEFFDVLGSLGITVNKRLGPKSGEVTGYSLAAPGDTNTSGEPVFYGGSKLAPDLSIIRIRETLTRPGQARARRTRPHPRESWQHADTALRHAAQTLDSDDDAAAQAHLAAYSTMLHNTALNAPPAYRAELRAAATAFNRARRSAIRADHQKATALRQAAKDLTYASHDAGGLPVAVIATLVHLAVAATRWYEQRGYQQQAAAAHRTLTHLHAGYRHAAAPVLADLARRTPHPQTTQRLEAAVRQAVPQHADRILTDPTWPALATTLAQAETAGHHLPTLLHQTATERELHTAHSPAETLTWRITTTPNHRATAARARTTTGAAPSGPSPAAASPVNASPDMGSQRHR
ncbi:relaxase/mobilization nuclease domain-containing protein [Actinacidiphila epipremni]|uniref:Mobilization protein n=1 Tax=Actinacidiphila epipremni TaxID=2053013 RepID=A0ABX0ZKI5_9ACTN|nr:mobilization protein [Actinacidiphila epipremni]NJP43241.1 mobilization protein [Actinacidiphila epipremni]